MNIVISHPGKGHWRWELLRNYSTALATGDVGSLREAWRAGRIAERHAESLGL